jgi:Zn-finger nucleic acid-binding protein
VCAHCGTTSFPDAVSRDGIRILGPGEPDRRCSTCALPFVRGMIDEYQVDYCEKCRGLLMVRRDFAELVRRRRAWAHGRRRRQRPSMQRSCGAPGRARSAARQ